MKFNIENLGKIKETEIALKNLTIICGPNSSNKTWLSYLIANFLRTVWETPTSGLDSELFNNFAEELINDGYTTLDSREALNEFKKCMFQAIEDSRVNLHNYFNVDKEVLADLKIKVDLSAFSVESASHHFPWKSDDSQEPVELELTSDQNSIAATLSVKGNVENPKQLRSRLINRLIIYIATTYTKNTFDRPYIVSSERTGALLFQKDLDRSTVVLDSLLKSLSNLEIDENRKRSIMMDLIDKAYQSGQGLPTPVKENLRDIRNAKNIMSEEGRTASAHPELLEILNKLNGGTFEYDEDDLTYRSEQSEKSFKITSASSSIKSLFLVDLYIKHSITQNDVLIIDEPELNLHPDNQRLMARLIARLVNAGVNVIITTHSDYIIREINNSIMLSNDFEDKESLMKSYDLKSCDVLSPDDVSSYSVDMNGEVKKMEVGCFGINTEIFDNIINKANQLQGEIYFNLEDEDE